jgi:DNA mismatch repair protein MutS
MARDDQPTPMIAQYLALRAEVPGCLLFYRMGDFFELFFDDAKAAAATLDIALTARGEHDGAPIPMCGVPVHSADAYLARLIRAGHRVAIAEQTESPAEAKKRGGKTLVSRAVVRVVTAGTLTEDALLDPGSANWLVALARVGEVIGVACADVSTGRFETLCCAPGRPGGGAGADRAGGDRVAEPLTARPARIATDGFDSLKGESALKKRYGVATLDGFGRFGRAELAAAGGLLRYLEQSSRAGDVLLEPPRSIDRATHMAIDEATRDSLELCTAAGGGKAGSLLGCIDRTVTGAGARMLGSDLSAPLTDVAAIKARLDLVAWLGDATRREAVRGALRALPDAARALGRLAAGRGSPRDLGQLRDGLAGARTLHDRLGREGDRPALLADLLPRLAGHGALTDTLARALVPAPPTEADKGGYIAEGYDAALDALRASGGEGRRAIAALEARYREATGVSSLKIRHNAVLGFHIEVSARHADRLMAAESGFTHRQTLGNAVRFNAPELHEVALRVTQSGAHAVAAEAAHLEELTALAMASARDRRTCGTRSPASTSPPPTPRWRVRELNWCRHRLVRPPCFEVEVAVATGCRGGALRKGGERFIATTAACPRLPPLAGTRRNMGGQGRPSSARTR